MRRVAVFALSGGSGRTTTAVEAACLVAAGGRRVAILDLDVPAPGVALRLGLPHRDRWHPALLGGDGITSLDDLLVTHRSGARVLAGPTSTVAPEAILPARVAELLHLLEQAGTELVVVDLPGDMGALTVMALGAMDEILVVVTPTPRGAQDAYRTTEALRRLGLGPRLRYVVNRAHQGDDLNEVIGDLAGEVAATIPFDADLEAGEATHRLAGLDGGGAAASAVRRLAAGLLGAPATAAAGGPGPDPRWG
jgi:MinD-like ATPase involved in chromosome partitioning or flagellar assembly